MYSKRAVRDLEKYLGNGKWMRLSPETALPQYQKQIKRSLAFLKTSFQFYLGEFGEMSKLIDKFFLNKEENRLKLFEGMKLNLPYPSFILCWSYPYDDNAPLDIKLKELYGNQDLKNCVIVNQETEDVISIQSISFNPHPNSRNWFISPLISFYTFGKDITQTEFYRRYENVVGSEYDKGRNFFIGTTVRSELTDKFLNDPSSLRVRQTEVAVVNLFLTLANCPNVSTKTIYKDKVKKKKKRKMNRLLDYKVLGVDMPSNTPKTRYSEKPDRTNKGIMPINWYKGHPKTYTEEAPLFGKLVGTWWWQPNVRGSKKAGFVSKDYSVETMT